MVRILVHLKLLRPLDRAQAEELRQPRPAVPRQAVRSEERLLAALRLGDDRLRLQPGARPAVARQLGAALRSREQGPDPDARRHARVLRGRPEVPGPVAQRDRPGRPEARGRPAQEAEGARQDLQQRRLREHPRLRRRRLRPRLQRAARQARREGAATSSPSSCRRRARRSGWTASASPPAPATSRRSTPSSTTSWSPRSTRRSSTASATRARTCRRAKFIQPEILNDPAIYPSEEALSKCEFIEDIGEATSILDEYWTEIKAQ